MKTPRSWPRLAIARGRAARAAAQPAGLGKTATPGGGRAGGAGGRSRGVGGGLGGGGGAPRGGGACRCWGGGRKTERGRGGGGGGGAGTPKASFSPRGTQMAPRTEYLKSRTRRQLFRDCGV